MQKEVKVGIASLKGSYEDLVQELLKIKQQYQNIVVYTTLLDKKDQQLAFAALELGIPYWVFVEEKKGAFKKNEKYKWLIMRAKKIEILQRNRKVQYIMNRRERKIISLQKKVIKMCDIVLRI